MGERLSVWRPPTRPTHGSVGKRNYRFAGRRVEQEKVGTIRFKMDAVDRAGGTLIAERFASVRLAQRNREQLSIWREIPWAAMGKLIELQQVVHDKWSHAITSPNLM